MIKRPLPSSPASPILSDLSHPLRRRGARQIRSLSHPLRRRGVRENQTNEYFYFSTLLYAAILFWPLPASPKERWLSSESLICLLALNSPFPIVCLLTFCSLLALRKNHACFHRLSRVKLVNITCEVEQHHAWSWAISRVIISKTTRGFLRWQFSGVFTPF